MDGSILLSGVVTNATETTLSYQFMTVVIAIVAVFLALGGLFYKVGKELGELKGTKEVVEKRLELFDEKYKTSERIQEVDGKLNTLATRFDAEKVAIAVKFESQSKMLDTINELKNELRNLRTKSCIPQVILRIEIATATEIL